VEPGNPDGTASEVPTEKVYRQIYKHTVPIINFDQSRPDQVGTGVFIELCEREFIITAAHVFESGFQKVGFGYLDHQGFHVFGTIGLPILTARAQSGGGNAQTAVYKDDLDLAIIEPDPQTLEALHEHYCSYNFRNCSFDLRAKSGVVAGWPWRKNKYNAYKHQYEFHTCYHIQCPILNVKESRAAGFNPDIFIALSADKKKDFARPSGERLHLPNLEGMSGGGFWVNSFDLEKGWGLAGILVEDDAPKRMLKVIRASHIWAPLRHFFGAGDSQSKV